MSIGNNTQTGYLTIEVQPYKRDRQGRWSWIARFHSARYAHQLRHHLFRLNSKQELCRMSANPREFKNLGHLIRFLAKIGTTSIILSDPKRLYRLGGDPEMEARWASPAFDRVLNNRLNKARFSVVKKERGESQEEVIECGT